MVDNPTARLEQLRAEAILRAPDPSARAEAMDGFERDLRVVANLLGLG